VADDGARHTVNGAGPAKRNRRKEPAEGTDAGPGGLRRSERIQRALQTNRSNEHFNRRTDRQNENLTGVGMSKAVRVRVRVRVRALVRRARAARRDAGMVTSEYAMGIIAAVAFAAVLYKVLTSGQVSAELQNIVKRALDVRM
jgi:hypothetical protein